MSRRFASLLVALPLASALAACAAAPPAAPASTPPTAASSASPVAPVTPVATAQPTRTPTSAPSSAAPDTGNVDRPGTPDFSVEPVGAQAIRVTLTSPDAKAWRISAGGTGAHDRDAWTLTVETGDVTPVITTTETANGVAGLPTEQSKLELGMATGRVCSVTLPVCVVASSIELPADGNGTIVLQLVRTDAAQALGVMAATASWSGDPFALGPWTETGPFPWTASS